MPEPGPAVGVVGLGRLGRAVVDGCAEQGLPVVLTATRAGWRADAVPDVIVDTSGPGAQEQVRAYCEKHRTALVECVSNVDKEQWVRLAGLAGLVPVVRATNLALGHHLQLALVRYVAALGRTGATACVWERHPATKAHRPSATAVALAQAWSQASGGPVDEVSSLRAGLPVSEHELCWTWPAETLAVRHSVGSLRAAAAGAVTAARWVAGREPGLVSMHAVYDDVLRVDRT